MSEKKKGVRYMTAPGVARFPHLDKLDTKFVKKEGDRATYNTGIILSAKDAAPLITIVDGIIEGEKWGKDRLKFASLPYQEQEDGTVVFRAKTYDQPKAVDANGEIIKKMPAVGGGSTIRLQGSMKAYDTGAKSLGVTAYLSFVQIIDLKEFSANPFGKAEGGSFKASDVDSSDSTDEAPGFGAASGGSSSEGTSAADGENTDF